MDDKNRQRQESLALVRALSRATRASKSEAIARRLLAHPALAGSGHGFVLAFAALPSEPDLSSLPRRSPRTRFCLPRVAGPDRLTIHQVPDFNGLVRSAIGIPEPDPARHPEVALPDIRAILVPGLAFSTRTGVRLGRGGGYYDRFLARPDLARPLRIGVCFDELAIPHVPADGHDGRVDEIATDRRLIRMS